MGSGVSLTLPPWRANGPLGHILGSFAHIKQARDACCNLILGSPPSKVSNSLRAVANRVGSRI